MSSTEEWRYDYDRNQLVSWCNEKIHSIFKDFPTIEAMLRQDVYGASFIDELQDLNRELSRLIDIFDKINEGASSESNK